MKIKLLILITFALFLAAVAGIAVVRARQLREVGELPVLKPAVVRVASLERRDFTITESFYGLIEAEAAIDLSFQIGGRVQFVGPDEKTPLIEGAMLEPGDVVAQIDPARYQAALEGSSAQEQVSQATLAGAKADYAQTLAGVEGAKAQLAQATAGLDEAKWEMRKQEDLVKVGAAQARDVERSEVAVRSATANVDLAKAALAGAQAVADAAKARIDSMDAAYRAARSQTAVAQVNLRDTRVLAPRRGKVAMVAVEPGQTVLPGQMVARLVALDTVRLVIGVVESKAPLLRVGQVVDVELLALRAAAAKRLDAVEAGRPRRGKVVILPPAADPRTGLFNVEVELDNAQGHLLPGMVGKASIRVETRQGYAIPAEAVVRAGTDDLWAFFIDNGMGVGVDLGALGHSEAQVRVPVVRRVKINPLLTRRDVYYVDQLPSGQQKLVVEGQARLSDLQPVSVIDMGTIGRVADRS